MYVVATPQYPTSWLPYIFRGNIFNKKLLVDKEYCHGDFRPPNILVDNDGRVFVIDFQWAGMQGTAQYPHFMNHAEIEWPKGAEDGRKIEAEHDKHWLHCLESTYLSLSPSPSP